MPYRLHIFILAATLILAAVPVHAADEVSIATLPSGLKLIVREGHATSLAAIDIWVRAGAINETAANCGVAHLIEHMIFKATEKYGPGQIDREIETLGADLNGGTTHDYTHFYTTVPSADLSTALNAIADAIVHPLFRAEDMDRERRVILDEIARSEADPFDRAPELLAGMLFPTQPYGRPQAGTRESVAKLTRDDLAAYYTAHFTPANTTVVIAGDVSKADAAALVEKAFEGYGREPSSVPLDKGDRRAAPRGSEPPRPSATPPYQGGEQPVTKRFPSPTSQAYVAVGFRVPGIADFRETCVLDALQILFGDTSHGFIADALTSAGIPFSKIHTDYVTTREPSVFSVTVAVEPKDADRVTPAVVRVFRRMASSGVSEGELSYARRLIEGSDLFDQETFAGQARALGYYDALKSCELSLGYVAAVRALKLEDITALGQKYFTTDGYAVALLAPGEAGK